MGNLLVGLTELKFKLGDQNSTGFDIWDHAFLLLLRSDGENPFASYACYHPSNTENYTWLQYQLRGSNIRAEKGAKTAQCMPCLTVK